MSKGLMLIVSGPSGTGKGTICAEYMKEHEETILSVSATTRKPRDGEVDGTHYYFLTDEEFDQMIAEDGFLEWAEYGKNRYGTPKKPVIDAMNRGKDVILEIEVQGAMQVKERYPEGVFVFVVPPSMEILRERLTGRNTETAQQVEMRLDKAVSELGEMDKYNYIIVNDKLDAAVDELYHITMAEKANTVRCLDDIKKTVISEEDLV